LFYKEGGRETNLPSSKHKQQQRKDNSLKGKEGALRTENEGAEKGLSTVIEV